MCLVQGDTVDSEHLDEMTEEEYEVNFVKPHLKGFVKIDAKYLIPFFTRRFTQQVNVVTVRCLNHRFGHGRDIEAERLDHFLLTSC